MYSSFKNTVKSKFGSETTVTKTQFDHVWKTTIKENLKDETKFEISEMAILLNSYLFWNYELKNTKTFDNIEETSSFFSRS